MKQTVENKLSSKKAKVQTPALIKAIQYSGLTLLHWLSNDTLKRKPEPFQLTEQEQHVEDYSKAINSVMILPYVLVLDLVHRLAQKDSKPKRAIDLCCGPGHFTRMLAQTMNCEKVIGVDLSEPMLEKARQNAKTANLSEKVQYIKSDVSSLEAIETDSMDIVSFMDGAHHMSSTQMVKKILSEADRVAKPEGVVILIDPVRPKTNRTLNLYHRIAGETYVAKGLKHFNQDFYDSLMASWSFDELFSAIPKGSRRKWVQLIPVGFPAFQILIGLPQGEDKIFSNPGLSQEIINKMIPNEGKADWNMLKMSFRMGRIRKMRSI